MGNAAAIQEIEKRVKELNKYGCKIPQLKTLLGDNNQAIEDFLIEMYNETISKAQNSINFTKSIKLINKNPSFHENFTFKNNTDVAKIIKNKQAKKAAFLMNFINSFTKNF